MERVKEEDSLIASYCHINTSTIGHLTSTGYLPDIKAIHCCDQTYVGEVLTVTLYSENTDILRQALINAKQGDVLCIDARLLKERACWGALRTCAAIYEKLMAVIVLGKVTDSIELKKLGFPIFAKGVSSLTTFQNNGVQGKLNSVIDYQVDDYKTQIRSGDMAIVDDDGVFILSKDKAQEILPHCEKKQRTDDEKLQIFLDAYKNDQLGKLFGK